MFYPNPFTYRNFLLSMPLACLQRLLGEDLQIIYSLGPPLGYKLYISLPLTFSLFLSNLHHRLVVGSIGFGVKSCYIKYKPWRLSNNLEEASLTSVCFSFLICKTDKIFVYIRLILTIKYDKVNKNSVYDCLLTQHRSHWIVYIYKYTSFYFLIKLLANFTKGRNIASFCSFFEVLVQRHLQNKLA